MSCPGSLAGFEVQLKSLKAEGCVEGGVQDFGVGSWRFRV